MSEPDAGPGTDADAGVTPDPGTNTDRRSDTGTETGSETGSGVALVARAARTLRRTRRVVGLPLRRRDGALVFAVVSALCLGAYLIAIGRLVPGRGAVGLLVVEDLSIALHSTGTFTFEPIARFDLGVLSVLFSPFDTVLGLGLAILVGINLSLFYLAWTQPAACGIDSAAGAFAAIPALLSGTACCGPVLLIVLGVQASGLLLAVFDVLLPVAVLLLLGSLALVGRNVDPTLL